jgi:glycosyltransferase involved in cell wall biosynthesis
VTAGPGGTAPDGSLRVALLNPRYWPEVRRGSERFARELADGLIALGHAPRLITSHRGAPSTTVEDGLEVVRNPRLPEGRLRRREFEDHLTHVPFSYRTLTQGSDDVAHAMYPTDGLAAAWWSDRTSHPAVLSWMGLASRRWLATRRLRARIALEAAAGAAAVTALSETAAAALRRELGVDARVIAPGVDLDAFSPGGERAPDPTIVCAAALHEPQKRVRLLAEAFALVRRDRPAARLVLSRPREQPPPWAHGDGIELRDLDDRAALAAAYREAWVSALPSWGEAFGLVLLEAMACGTPAVGSTLGAIPEVVNDDALGRLFDGDRPENLARALLEAFELASDPATAAACRARAEEFPASRTAESYAALYRELIG